jgi:hypothetical protein
MIAFYFLWLDRVTGILPGCKPAKDWSNLLEALFRQELRRTGARLFGRSSAIGNNRTLSIQFVESLR